MNKKAKMTTWEKNQLFWGWLFIIPTMAGLIILNLYPIASTIYQSFCKTGDFGKGNVFVGFENYAQLYGSLSGIRSSTRLLKFRFRFVSLLSLQFC